MFTAGIVCEGQSDFAILNAVIQKLCPEIDDVLLLQPILDSVGHAQGASGASGVRSWCTQFGKDLDSVIDPGVGPRLDLLVIAMDADAAIESGIDDPPRHASAYDGERLCAKIRSWLGALPRQVVIAIPAMAIESWVIAARYAQPANPERIAKPAHHLVEKKVLALDTRPKRQHKVIKPPAKYQTFGSEVASRWSRVVKRCGEANRFDRKVKFVQNQEDR
jgi:hypothetical protein